MRVKRVKKIIFLLVITSFLTNITSNNFETSNHTSQSVPNSANSDSWSIFIKEDSDIIPRYIEVINESIYVISSAPDGIYVNNFNKSREKVWEYHWKGKHDYMYYDFDSEHNLIVISSEVGGNNFYLKIDDLGNELFSVNISSCNLDFIESTILVENDSIIVYGNSKDTNLPTIIKLNNNGNLIWNTLIPFNKYINYYTNLISDSKNNVYIITRSLQYSTILSKFNTSGALLWNITSDKTFRNIDIDYNDNLYLFGYDEYYEGWIIKINESGSVVKEKNLGHIGSSSTFKSWYLNNLFILINGGKTLVSYDLNLTLRWNISISEYYILNTFPLSVSIVQNMQDNLFISYDNPQGNICLIEISDMGDFVSELEWGGNHLEQFGMMVVDSEVNIFFICRLIHVNVWGDINYYAVLVKNPRDGGMPPVPLRNFDIRDYFLFSFLGVSIIVSTTILFSIIKYVKKRIPEL